MKKEFDLTQGGISKKLLNLAFPIIGTEVFQMFYNFIDMFFVGRLSSDAIAATGLAGVYIWLSVAFFLIGGMGAEIGVSQHLGKGEKETAKKYAINSVMIAIILGCLYGLVMIIFRQPLIAFLRIPEVHIIAEAASYLAIVSISTPMIFISIALASAFEGAGNAKFPFYIKSGGLLLNIILSPIFIFTFSWGIQGAALATVIAQTLVCLVFLWAIKYHPSRPFTNFKYSDFLLVPFCKHIFFIWI